jgi:hypothetical protein
MILSFSFVTTRLLKRYILTVTLLISSYSSSWAAFEEERTEKRPRSPCLVAEEPSLKNEKTSDDDLKEANKYLENIKKKLSTQNRKSLGNPQTPGTVKTESFHHDIGFKFGDPTLENATPYLGFSPSMKSTSVGKTKKDERIEKLETAFKMAMDKSYRPKSIQTAMDLLLVMIHDDQSGYTLTFNGDIAETSQFRAILKCFTAAYSLEASVWESINAISDKSAAFYFKVLCNFRAKNPTFFSAYFDAVSLDFSFNKFTELDVSMNSKLQVLNAENNPLKTINVSNNPELRELYLTDTSITELDVSKNPKLQCLVSNYCNLKKIDVSNNPDLTDLEIGGNLLTEINVTQNPELRTLCVGDGKIIKIDISKNPMLNYLILYNNQIKALDVSHNLKLKEMNLTENPLKKEDIKGLRKEIRLEIDEKDEDLCST